MGGASDYYLELDALNLSNIPDKYVCVRHFEDKAINNFIRKNYFPGHCDYCYKDVKVLSLEMVLKFMMEGINNFFEDATNYQGYESRGGGFQGITFDVNDLIQERIDLRTQPFNLTEDIIDSIVEIPWSNYYDHYSSPTDDLRNKWKYFKDVVKNETRYFFQYRNAPDYYLNESFNAQDILKELGKYLTEYNLLKIIPKNTSILRTRQHSIAKSNEIKKIQQLVSPEIKYARFANRFSPSGIPMFYGGFEKSTIIKEVYNEGNTGAKRLTVGYFKNLNEIRVVDFTKIPKIPGVFEPKRFHHYFDLLFLHQLTRDLSEPVKLDKYDHIEYVPTQIITEFIRYPFNQHKRKKIEGIIYPSAKNNGKPCLVLFWNQEECLNNLKLEKTEIIRTKDI